MSHSQKYREVFTEGQTTIYITDNISMVSDRSDKYLKIDSYDNPVCAILHIGGNICDENVEFNGIIYFDISVKYYGHITCKHAYFSEYSYCYFSRLTVDTVEVDIDARVEFAYNESILGYIGEVNTQDVWSYFPNLLISRQIDETESSLICLYTIKSRTYALIDKTHFYYAAIENLVSHYFIHANNKSSIIIHIDDFNNYFGYYELAEVLIHMIKAIKKYNRPLIKNANK